MPELGIDGAAVGECPSRNRGGNLLQRFEMGCRIAITPSMIGNDGDALLEELD